MLPFPLTEGGGSVEIAASLVDEVIEGGSLVEGRKNALEKLPLPLHEDLGKGFCRARPAGNVSLPHSLHQQPAEPLPLFPGDHVQFPRLHVDGRRRLGCQKEQPFQGFPFQGLVEKGSGAPALLNRFQEVHFVSPHIFFEYYQTRGI